MKVAFFGIQDWERELLAGTEFVGEPNMLNEDHLVAENAAEAVGFPIVSVFAHSEMNRQVIEGLPDLRMIAARSTGVDHIDLDAARERGIVVSSVPGYGANTVAEHTFGMILGLSRRLFAAHTKVLDRDFSLEGLRGFDLNDKTMGVIGAGSIGLHVIRMARALGMRVLAYDTQPMPLIAEVLDFEYVEMDQLLAESHVISLHAPLTSQTHHMINAETLAKMRPGVLLVNTSRGGLVDLQAVAEALDSGHLGGVGLDVFEGEECVNEETRLVRCRERPKGLDMILGLLDRPNVMLTPHIAFYSDEALERIINTTIENIRAFEAGVPVNRVA
ncbi:MAG: hydroxyacid dehydrogenase [Armatimonadetes bacterium]|nr:hydroxyacid dehydrogenase [Armatimonadota bacterium]NIM23183.1 hydroxyacid dehydrogenase [Armatimonadota bacterium]NIM67051.1 hydroxyacid dehydrogenase [Armatimonadota bacterium]NIM75585.1 hydroxyacid dehydrogenase [Armatimonadota bacterium]NIN05240.1 hydroxyacid dehydrogenase [Armatimonadota bacterium]